MERSVFSDHIFESLQNFSRGIADFYQDSTKGIVLKSPGRTGIKTIKRIMERRI